MLGTAILNRLGTLLLFQALAMAAAAAWSFTSRGDDRWAFAWAIAVTAAVGALLYGLTLKTRQKQLSMAESFALVTLAWLFCAAAGALPYFFYGLFERSYLDAFFESISGFTTTGATLISDIEVLPRGILFWRGLTQWLGGMGIIVLFVAILPRFGFRSLTMFKAELPGPISERVVPRVVEAARRLWQIYLGLTVLQAVLLILCGVQVFDALAHALTTLPTGGFSTYNGSIGALHNPAAEIVIIIFMFGAGVNFVLYYRLLSGDVQSVRRNQEFRFYLGMTVLAVAFTTVNIYPGIYPNLFEGLRKAAFQVVSILTTTGYGTADFDSWPSFSRVLLFFLMFAGACGGSTGGAIKQIRLLILAKYAYRELHRMVHPSAVSPIRIGDQVLPEDMLRGVIGFSFLYVFFFVFSTLALSGMGLDFTTASSAVAATLGNVGPGLGLVGPTHTYQVIPDAGKALLCLMMILGRLEIYTVLVMLLPEARRLLRRTGNEQRYYE